MTALPSDRLALTVREAAPLLGLTPKALHEQIRQGRVPAVHLGRRVLVSRRALEALFDGEEGGAAQTTAPPTG